MISKSIYLYRLGPHDIKEYILVPAGSSWYQRVHTCTGWVLMISKSTYLYRLGPHDIKECIPLPAGSSWYQRVHTCTGWVLMIECNLFLLWSLVQLLLRLWLLLLFGCREEMNRCCSGRFCLLFLQGSWNLLRCLIATHRFLCWNFCRGWFHRLPQLLAGHWLGNWTRDRTSNWTRLSGSGSWGPRGYNLKQ